MTDKSHREEHYIANICKNILDTTYSKTLVDVGANNDAIFSSNFPDFKKILIEPNPDLCISLRNIYLDDIVINKACGNVKETRKLYLPKDKSNNELSTLSCVSDPWFDNVRSEEYINVCVDTLTNILEENNFEKNFSILKIDCESWDPFVIEGLDFTKYRPKIIITEDYYWDNDKIDEKFFTLENNGYVLLEIVGYNSIWVLRTRELYSTKLYMKDFFYIIKRLDTKYIEYKRDYNFLLN